MHILILPSFYPSTIRPSTGIFFVDQVEALREAGHQVGVLIAPRLYETVHHMRSHHELPPSILQSGGDSEAYRLHSIWVPRIFPLVSALIYGRAARKAFRYYCQQHGTPDLIHAHNIFYGGYMAVHIAKEQHIPVVLTEHSTNYLRGRIFLPGQHIIARHTLGRIDKPLAVGQTLADYLNTKYNPKFKVKTIANVVDTDYFVPGTKDDVFTFAAVGQMTKRKRFDLLISAFTQAFRDQTVKLMIGGHGSEYQKLEELISSLNMGAQIELVGHLSREGVRDLFQRVHVVVSSSNIETFGVTLIEAMSCGKPIIATHSGGPEQFVTDETGILIPRENQQALADALTTIMHNYDTYDRLQIRDLCIARFSKQAIVTKLNHIYEQALSNQNKTSIR